MMMWDKIGQWWDRQAKRSLRKVPGNDPYHFWVTLWNTLTGKKRSAPRARDWTLSLDHPRMDPVLKTMLLACEVDGRSALLSAYWKELINRNVAQLLKSGFENFKQTVALHYFTFLLKEDNPQVLFLKKALSPDVVAALQKKAQGARQHAFFDAQESAFYDLVTLLLWEYARSQVPSAILSRLDEPLLGNPPAFDLDGRWIAQDLANSALEYQGILDGAGDLKDIRTVIEIGAGYGRSSYVVLKLNPGVRYIIVDIPPALYISQRYLSGVFPDRKIFTFRDFNDFAEIQDEFMSADIIFLMPFQMQKLPAKIAELGLAIDCFHEMLPRTLDAYFGQIDRLASRLYFKCWKHAMIPLDGIQLTESDYPVRPDWKKIYSRECRVQTTFFESFYAWDDK